MPKPNAGLGHPGRLPKDHPRAVAWRATLCDVQRRPPSNRAPEGYRRINKSGYAEVKRSGHPRANNGYVLEHIMVVEAAIGRPLPPRAHVHHVDGACANNAPTNLVACEDAAYHKLLHIRQRALEACGNADWRKCGYCGQHDDPARMVVHNRLQPNRQFCHRACRSARNRGGAQ